MVRVSIAATSFSVASVAVLVDGRAGGCCTMAVMLCGVPVVGKNSAIRSAMTARAVTSVMLVLARMELMLTGRVLRKTLQRTASVGSKVNPKALRSSKTLARKTEGFCVPSVCVLKYLAKTSAFGSWPKVRIALFSFSYG